MYYGDVVREIIVLVLITVLVTHFPGASGDKAVHKNDTVALQTTLQDSSSGCGGKLQATDGAISYKNFSPYGPNERCVWTVRAANATSYNVQLDSIGVSGTLIISGFGLVGLVSHTTPTAASNISVPNTNVMVITFLTSSEVNTNKYKGFSLRYTSSIIEENHKASATSEDIIVPANSGHIKYPSNASFYGNFDLSIIVIVPPFGIQSASSDVETEVIYIRSGLEGQSCQDKISVYGFERSSYSGARSWKLLGRMCGGIDSEIISRQDLIMFVFESDFSGVSSGFHLYTRYDRSLSCVPRLPLP